MSEEVKPRNDDAAAASPENAEEDPVLVKRAQQGDVDAYSELMRRHQGKIYGLIYNMTGNQQDTEDLVQDVFLKGFKVLKRFKGKSSFYTWIYRIAVNRTINFLKKRRNRAAVSLHDMDGAVESDPAYVELSSRESPFRDASLSELQERLNAALQTLSEKHRAVVILHDIQGVPHEEIGKMLGCSPGTVRSRLFYARQQLQAELSEYTP
jgi:RNA polymerase sigma factor (sigma-70 family)